MKMVSVRDLIEKIIEAEFSKVCAADDEIWWDCGPDTMAEVEHDEDDEPALSNNPHWAVQIVITNPAEEMKAHLYLAFNLHDFLDQEAVTQQVAEVASDLCFRRQVYDVTIEG
jgi:hypothetical protein